jgi:hypothetical protein
MPGRALELVLNFEDDEDRSFPGGLNDLNIVLFSGLGVLDFLICGTLVKGANEGKLGSLCGTLFDRVVSLPPLFILEGSAGREGKGGRARSE